MSKNVTLYPYKQHWMLDGARFKIGCLARQTGKTFSTTLEIVDGCLRVEALGGSVRWVVLSRGERQAKEAMEKGGKSIARRTVWPSVKLKAA